LQEVKLKKAAARMKNGSVRIVFPVANKNKGKEQKNRRTGISNRRTEEQGILYVEGYSIHYSLSSSARLRFGKKNELRKVFLDSSSLVHLFDIPPDPTALHLQ
jgi:hypothetical protein